MMPVLRAQEAIADMNHMGASFGGMEEASMRSMQLELELTAARGKQSGEGHDPLGRNAYRPKSAQELAALSEGTTAVVIG